jgi:hypothetical protein
MANANYAPDEDRLIRRMLESNADDEAIQAAIFQLSGRQVTVSAIASRRLRLGLRRDSKANEKLTPEKARAIRASTQSAGALAQAYGVSKDAIVRVRRGATWKNA